MNISNHHNKNSLFLNNNNFEMDKNTPGCSSKNLDDRSNEEFQNFNEVPGEDADSDENQVNLSDSYDELPVSDDDDDVQLSSPSNSLNSDVDQRWYAIRGRWGINPLDNNHNDINNRLLDNRLPHENNQPPLHPQQQPQDDEETDFLEMDFEPDTNSEIENECLPNGHQQLQSNTTTFNFHKLPSLPLPLSLPQPEFQHSSNLPLAGSSRMGNQHLPTEEPEIFSRPQNRNTGAKPKQLSAQSRSQKISKHVSDGDDTFKMCSTINNNNNIESSSSLCLPASIYSCSTNSDEVYNLGASSSRAAHSNLYHDQQSSYSHDVNSFMKIHKSPAKSSSHHNHKHQRLHEEQNDQFLFEIEPIKPRNSVTIYTTNCDEKILIDALTSLNLEPNREIITAYFNRSKPSVSTTVGTASNCELNLVDYIIYRSKLNCNFMKLIELIQRACKSEDEDSYSDKKFDINFYPLDLFSTTPEMVEVPVDAIVQRWSPQTDLSPLVTIRNKYFYQTNVLGKIVNIIRKINQKPPATFKDKETIKIPQFYVSGYLTITMTTNQLYKST